MKVVVLVRGGLSETLQVTPLLRALRTMSGVHITLAGPRVASTLEGSLATADVILPLAGLEFHAGPGRRLAVWRALRSRRFDVVVVCSRRRGDRLLAYATGIPGRVGVGGMGFTFLLSDHVRPRGLNNSRNWARLAHLLGGTVVTTTPDFTPPKEACERIDGLLATAGIEPGRILVAVAPGVAHADPGPVPAPRLRWEPARYAHLANQLAHRHGAAVVLLGPESDRAAVDATLLDLAAPHIDLCGELSLEDTAAVLARCDVLVCGDSPLLHFAAAMDTPTLGLYGPTQGVYSAPYGPTHRLLQALPARRGQSGEMSRIRVEDALAGVEMAR